MSLGSRALPFVLLVFADSASAIISVGPSSGPRACGCKYTSIQRAIDDVLAQEHAATDTTSSARVDPFISVVGDSFYNEALVIDSSGVTGYTDPLGRQGAFVQIYGDYAGDAGQNKEDGSVASIGSGNKSAPVATIQGSNPVHVNLNHLLLTDAKTSFGGGIFFGGHGSLDLANVEITGNSVDYSGGGIYADSTVGLGGAEITLHSGTWIHNNGAGDRGGGIFINGQTHLFVLEDNTLIEYNQAVTNGTGLGGGLFVYGPAIADIGSTGLNNAPVISHNSAYNGGGVAVEYSGIVRLFSTIASTPARIEFNTATNQGGGVYAYYRSLACGDGYSISYNHASDGAAVYTDLSASVDLTANGLLKRCVSPSLPLPPRADCPSCNAIVSNFTTVSDVGAAITTSVQKASVADQRSSFYAERVLLIGNGGANLVANYGSMSLTNCLVTANSAAQGLFVEHVDTASLNVDLCTLTGNTIVGEEFNTAGNLDLENSILWEPGVQTLNSVPGSTYLANLIASDGDALNQQASGFAAFSNVESSNPLFVDPGSYDFHLQAISPALDYSRSGSSRFAPTPPANDLDGSKRPVSLLRSGTPYDIGAYELQSLPANFPCTEPDKIFCDRFEG